MGEKVPGDCGRRRAAGAHGYRPADVLSAAYTSVGYLFSRLGNPQAAEAPYAASIRIREQLASLHPNDLLFRRYLRLAHEHFGELQASPMEPNLGHPEIARAWLQRELDRGGASL